MSTLDIITTVLGLLYIWYEYHVSIMVWIVGIIMPALDIILYWQHGLYGDSILAGYYLVAAIYGFVCWHMHLSEKSKSADGSKTATVHTTHMPKQYYLPAIICFAMAWVAVWAFLKYVTDSTVPMLDGLTNALSFIAMWALAKRYCEQWLLWIAVDAISCYLYAIKGLPFKTGLYALYIIIAIAGYIKWNKLARTQASVNA